MKINIEEVKFNLISLYVKLFNASYPLDVKPFNEILSAEVLHHTKKFRLEVRSAVMSKDDLVINIKIINFFNLPYFKVLKVINKIKHNFAHDIELVYDTKIYIVVDNM